MFSLSVIFESFNCIFVLQFDVSVTSDLLTKKILSGLVHHSRCNLCQTTYSVYISSHALFLGRHMTTWLPSRSPCRRPALLLCCCIKKHSVCPQLLMLITVPGSLCRFDFHTASEHCFATTHGQQCTRSHGWGPHKTAAERGGWRWLLLTKPWQKQRRTAARPTRS